MHSAPGPKAIALEFVDRINAHDPDLLAQLMTEDHAFIDADGNTVVGRERMRDGWVGYYRLFPDYRVEIDEVIVRNDEVVLIGRSDGTLSPQGRVVLAGPDGAAPPDDEMQGPAIWTAEIRDRLVARWHVFRDTAATRAKLGVGPSS
jgi:ketosteroid isomerase-like protein